MGLNSENRRDIVLYRIERAYKAIEQAKGCLALSYFEVTANRLYYAAYYGKRPNLGYGQIWLR